MVDSNTSLLISSIIINVLLIIERIMSKMKRSKCCGSELEMKTSSPNKSNSGIELTTPPDKITFSNIKTINESL
jgi:hypothetical protein